MAITRVNAVKALVSSDVITLPAFSATTGNLIALVIRSGANTTVTVTSNADTALNTYTLIDSDTTHDPAMFTYYAKNITGNASNVITVTLANSGGFSWAFAAEYSGLDPTAPLDTHHIKTATAATDQTSNSFSTAQASELVLLVATLADSNTIYSAGTDFTLIDGRIPVDAAFQKYGGAEEYITGGTLSSYTAHITSDTSAAYTVGLMAFKAGAAAPPPPGNMDGPFRMFQMQPRYPDALRFCCAPNLALTTLRGQDVQFAGAAQWKAYDWPNPKIPRYPESLRSATGVFPALIASAPPPTPTDTPVPPKPAPYPATLRTLTVGGALGAQPSPVLPVSDWTIPRALPYPSHLRTFTAYYMQDPTVDAPRVQSDWPVPTTRTYPIELRFGRAWATVAMPIPALPPQDPAWDMPVPKAAPYPVNLRTNTGVPAVMIPAVSVLQGGWDWPVPKRAASGTSLKTWWNVGPNLPMLVPQTPFTQTDWPLPRRAWFPDALRALLFHSRLIELNSLARIPITPHATAQGSTAGVAASTFILAQSAAFQAGDCGVLAVALADPTVTVASLGDDATGGPMVWTRVGAWTRAGLREELWVTALTGVLGGGSFVRVTLSGPSLACAAMSTWAGVQALGRLATSQDVIANPSQALVTQDANNVVVAAFASVGTALATAVSGTLRVTQNSSGTGQGAGADPTP